MNIAVYRTKALAHVSASLIQLQQMHADLEDLRDRVAAPALLADSGKNIQDIPLEVHIESIRKGIERLNTGRSKAKSIETRYVFLTSECFNCQDMKNEWNVTDDNRLCPFSYMRGVIRMHDEAIKVLDTRGLD